MGRFAIRATITAPHFVASRIAPRLRRELGKPVYRKLGVVLEDLEITELRE